VVPGGLITGVMTTFLLVGTLVGGWLGDHFSKRRIIVLAMFGHTTAMLILTFATNLGMLVAFAVIHGFSWGSRGPLINALRADYFGRGSFGKVMGFSSVIIGLGSMVGPMFAGVTYDVTGSYRIAFAVAALAIAASAVAAWVAAPRRARVATRATSRIGP
jgi:MFS family permease